jgi:hypothetical protein
MRSPAKKNRVVWIRAGYIRDRLESVDETLFDYPLAPEVSLHYINPYLALEGRRAGFGIGLVRSSQKLIPDENGTPDGPDYQPSLHLRFGNPSTAYVSTSYLEHLPLYSGGGGADLGIGVVPSPKVDFWFGVGGGVYDATGFLLKLNVRPHPSWALHTSLFLAGTEDEYGVALGLSYSIIRR